jgi:hypothetical protein
MQFMYVGCYMETLRHMIFNLCWAPWCIMIIILKEIHILFLQFCKTNNLKDQNMDSLRKKIPIFASPKDKICQGFQFLVLHSILFFRIKLFVRSLLFGLVNLQDQQKMNTFKTKWILFHFFLFKVFIFSSCELIRQKKVSLKRSTLFGLAKL